jgi:hypothetical protein
VTDNIPTATGQPGPAIALGQPQGLLYGNMYDLSGGSAIGGSYEGVTYSNVYKAAIRSGGHSASLEGLSCPSSLTEPRIGGQGTGCDDNSGGTVDDDDEDPRRYLRWQSETALAVQRILSVEKLYLNLHM